MLEMREDTLFFNTALLNITVKLLMNFCCRIETD
jgi:hypothetical protein